MLWMLLGACLIHDDVYRENLERLSDADQDGYSVDDDCDDTDPAVFPGATETCNGIDDDCSGVIDDGAADALVWFRDADHDGFGDEDETAAACSTPEGFTDQAGDCDDADGDTYPGADETAYDGIDNDCLGGDLVDVDGDGADAAEVGGPDCDDGDAEVYPGADETWANGATDNDCDGEYGGATLEYGASAWTGEAEGDNAGRRLTALGDVTGDGLAEFVVAAPYRHGDFVYGGAVYVVSGGEPGPLAQEGVLRSGGEDWLLGHALAGGADLDGDAVPDLLIAANGYDSGRGAVFLVSGADLPGEGEETSIADVALSTVWGEQEASYMGGSVAMLGDVDGDGVDDVALSANFADGSGLQDNGAVAIFSGIEGDRVFDEADMVLEGFYDEQYFGTELADAGDQDGDGYCDYMVGHGSGIVAQVFPGGVEAPSTEDGELTTFYQDDDSLDSTAQMVGDLDGDGRPDAAMIVANYHTYFFTDLAASPSRTETNARSTIEMDGDAYVFRVLNVGDLDGDGLDETVVPAKWYEPTGGALAVIVFGESLLAGSANAFADVELRAISERSTADYGYRLALVGDTTGDGRNEVLMGGSGDDAVAKNAGAVATFALPE